MFLRIQLTIFQHCFRKWLGAEQATNHYLNQCGLGRRRIYASLGFNELISALVKYTKTASICRGCVCRLKWMNCMCPELIMFIFPYARLTNAMPLYIWSQTMTSRYRHVLGHYLAPCWIQIYTYFIEIDFCYQLLWIMFSRSDDITQYDRQDLVRFQLLIMRLKYILLIVSYRVDPNQLLLRKFQHSGGVINTNLLYPL